MAFLRVTEDVDHIPVARYCQKLGTLYLIFIYLHIKKGGTMSNFFSGVCTFFAFTAQIMVYYVSYLPCGELTVLVKLGVGGIGSYLQISVAPLYSIPYIEWRHWREYKSICPIFGELLPNKR